MSEAPLRVAMVARRVHPAHGPGGLERSVYDLVTRIAARGVAVDLYTSTPADMHRAVAASEVMPPGVVVNWIPDRWLPIGRARGTVVLDRITNYPLWCWRVARWLEAANEELPDVVHAHGLAGWGFLSGAPPMVLSVHGMEEFQVPRGVKRWAYAPFRAGIRRAAAASAAVIATDRALQPLVESYLGVAIDRQTLIPNAVDAESCRAAADQRLGRQLLEEMGLSEASPMFLSVGRVAPNKGFEVMVEALARAAPDLPQSWAWILVGDGPSRARVEAAAEQAGIGERIRLAGRLEDVELHSLASIADWFVHPTLYEGSSIATLEAMAHGLPVIASRIGGLPDKVRDGETGCLVTPGEAAELAVALVESVGADGRVLGAAGRALCESRFDWSVVVESYIDLYRRLAT